MKTTIAFGVHPDPGKPLSTSLPRLRMRTLSGMSKSCRGIEEPAALEAVEGFLPQLQMSAISDSEEPSLGQSSRQYQAPLR